MRNIYVGSLEHSADLFGALLTSFASEGGLPAVFHCHAGKDRTGIVAALVLLAVGVDRETVLDDYELTRRYRTFENQQDSYANMIKLGMSPEAAYVMEKPHLRALPPALPAVYEVFDRVVDLYGFVSVDTNRYSVPERLVGKAVTVYKYHASIEIHQHRR